MSASIRLLSDAAAPGVVYPAPLKRDTSNLLVVLIVVTLLAIVSGGVWMAMGVRDCSTICTPTEVAQRIDGTSAPSKNATYPLRFYLYDELNNVEPPKCYACGTYTCVMQAFVSKLLKHEWRTNDPRAADVFIIPFSLFGSMMGSCPGEEHWQRVVHVLRTLEHSAAFRRSQGRDHFWLVPHYLLGGNGEQHPAFINPAFLQPRGVLQHIIWGRYWRIRSRALSALPGRSDNWAEDEMSWMRTFGSRADRNMVFRRNVVAPMHASFFFDYGDADAAWRAWKARSNLFLFRGGHRDCLGASQEQRDYLMKGAGRRVCARLASLVDCVWACAAVAPLLARSSMHRNVASSQETYVQEIQTHKFCFVVRCDDMQTSRFMDALAADCIPVIMSDGWRWVTAPFFESLNYDAFTFKLSGRGCACARAAHARRQYSAKSAGERSGRCH